MLCFVMCPSNGAGRKEAGASGSSSRTTAAAASDGGIWARCDMENGRGAHRIEARL